VLRNLILGLLIGLAGGWLVFSKPPLSWWLWMFFALGCALIVLAMDVFFGSRKEHEIRASWLGLILLGGLGAAFLLIVFLSVP
jgi:lipoprotein signal peptidase